MEYERTWSAVLDLCRELGPVSVRISQFADKPAMYLDRREFVHWEAPGRIDLRITAAGWRQHAAEFGADPAVHHDRGRRDWIDLHLPSPDDVQRLRPLFETAVRANS